MDLEKSYKNISESTKIIKWTIAFSLLLNLSTIHEWLQQKEANTTTATFLKLTEALKDIGMQFGLNTFRDTIRSQFLQKSQVASTLDKTADPKLNPKLNPRLNPLLPDLDKLPQQDRKVAAVEPLSENPEDFDFTELEAIDEIIDEPVITAQPAVVQKGILIIGDSILKSGLQEHFERNLLKRDHAITMDIKSKSGTGLSRPDVFDWIDFVDKTKDQYQKTLIFLGTNDAQNLLLGKAVIPFDSKEWREEYAKRIRSLLQKTCSKSKKVYWVSALKMRSDSFDAKMRSLHDVARKEIKENPGCAQFISAGSWFTKKSKYTDTWVTDSKKNGKKSIKLRVSDGIHLTYWGADLFSQKLIESIYE